MYNGIFWVVWLLVLVGCSRELVLGLFCSIVGLADGLAVCLVGFV